MEAVEQPETAEELRLLLDWTTDADQSRTRRAGIYSIAVHAVAILLLLLMPRQVFLTAPPTHRVTPLIEPPTELTQIAPNRGKISKEFNVEALRPKPRMQIPPSPPAASRPKAPAMRTPTPKPAQPAAMPEPPKIEAAANKENGPKLPQGMEAPPPPQIQAEEKPKLAFETPGAASSGNQGLGKVAPPSASVSEAVRAMSHGGSGGGIVVGDIGSGPGGIGEAINQPPSPGKQGSNLELLSDPMGVDFKPYLMQILQTVRRNWFSVMPESAKLGRTGKVALQFAIAKNGEVTKIVYATESGVEAFDRAAVASVSMSNPFPPLPTEFRGNVVRLQFTFSYNVRTVK
jgi:TonB family protein